MSLEFNRMPADHFPNRDDLEEDVFVFPASFAQQRLWVLDQLEPNSSTYNIPLAYRLTGPLNVPALEKSLNSIVERHETLRTTFSIVEEQPVQIIAPSLSLSLPVEDLRYLPLDRREAEAQRLLSQEARQPFDLSKGPLVRTKLFVLDEEESIWLLTMHHVISDGWSIGVLVRDFATLYEAYEKGAPTQLPALPIQYADFTVWQRQHLQGELLEKHSNYWKQQLQGLSTLELLTDRFRPPIPTYCGARLTFSLSEALSDAVKALSNREGTTLFMTLLAAFQVLLARYSGQADIAIGSPIGNRNRPELEGLIGFFVNTLVLRTDLSGNPCFTEVLQRVREICLGAYDHQDLPFEKLVEELQPGRDLSRNPLFQVMFQLQSGPSAKLELTDVTALPYTVSTETAKFDLTLFLQDHLSHLSGALGYSTDLFDAATIELLAQYFQTLLAGIVERPDQGIWELPLISDEERHKLLIEWNHTGLPHLEDQCLHHLFEAQAVRFPEATAVVFNDTSLTYQALNERANQLAHHLQSQGVGPEVCVGICVERSLEMVIGLLAILKTGGTYIPLDPTFPQDRLAFMLQDAGASMVVAQSSLREHLSAHTAHLVYLDIEWQDIDCHPTTNPISQVVPSNLAYVTYTSGSTGTPKGVQIPHMALSNFLHTMLREPELTAQDTLVAITTISFDIAGLELYLPLVVGAKVVVVSQEVSGDGLHLKEQLQHLDATVMQATPATWQLLIEAEWEGTPNLKMLCGGESLSRDLAEQLLARGGTLWNMYGPTETTIWSAVQQIEKGQGPVLIGRPMANTQFYVLDAHLQSVPIDIAGELYIGGAGVARGYWERPTLTAKKFIPHLFNSEVGARLYKTGDLVRYRPDGTLEFLGRLDHQVKVRGFRIELGEIESVLRHHPAVQEAVVIVREDQPGDHRMVGYVQFQSNQDVTVTEIRTFLRTKLPAYMVPAHLITMETFPLTPNGKVDRRALPGVDRLQLPSSQIFVPPRTSAEKVVASVWQKVLGIDHISVHDNFFDLGGHSLLSIQVLYQVEKALGYRFHLRDLFLFPLEHLAAQCEAKAPPPPESPPKTWRQAWLAKIKGVLWRLS